MILLAGLRVYKIAKIRGQGFDLDARTLRVTGRNWTPAERV